MKIVVVRKFTKNGIRFYAYKHGLLTRLKIFCYFNSVHFTVSCTQEHCIAAAREELRPGPDPDRQIISIVDLDQE